MTLQYCHYKLFKVYSGIFCLSISMIFRIIPSAIPESYPARLATALVVLPPLLMHVWLFQAARQQIPARHWPEVGRRFQPFSKILLKSNLPLWRDPAHGLLRSRICLAGTGDRVYSVPQTPHTAHHQADNEIRSAGLADRIRCFSETRRQENITRVSIPQRQSALWLFSF